MNQAISGGVKAKVFAVFEKLDQYYDDNDKTLECLFFDRSNAEIYVKERYWLDLIIEELNIY